MTTYNDLQPTNADPDDLPAVTYARWLGAGPDVSPAEAAGTYGLAIYPRVTPPDHDLDARFGAQLVAGAWGRLARVAGALSAGWGVPRSVCLPSADTPGELWPRALPATDVPASAWWHDVVRLVVIMRTEDDAPTTLWRRHTLPVATLVGDLLAQADPHRLVVTLVAADDAHLPPDVSTLVDLDDVVPVPAAEGAA